MKKYLLSGTKNSYKYKINLYLFEIYLFILNKDDITDYHRHNGDSLSILLFGKYGEKYLNAYKVRWLPLSFSFIPRGDYHFIKGISKNTYILNIHYNYE